MNDYYVREGRGFSVVFALTPRDEVVLVREFKYGIGRIMLELPSGLINEGETPRDAALRELAEETGYVADTVDFVRTLVADATNSTVLMHLYLARGARVRARQRFDVTENIDVELTTLDGLKEKLRDGQVESAFQVAGIATILDLLERQP